MCFHHSDEVKLFQMCMTEKNKYLQDPKKNL